MSLRWVRAGGVSAAAGQGGSMKGDHASCVTAKISGTVGSVPAVGSTWGAVSPVRTFPAGGSAARGGSGVSAVHPGLSWRHLLSCGSKSCCALAQSCFL